MCAAKNIDYEIKDANYPEMKEDREQYPFGQCPRSGRVTLGGSPHAQLLGDQPCMKLKENMQHATLLLSCC